MSSKFHVVVVDDERPNLESLERILKADGATVSTFLDAETALSFIRESRPDVVMTDLRMKGWSGMDLLEAVRLLDNTVEVILMTAYGTVEIAVDAMKKGAYDFITKPLKRVEVLKALHRALDRRRLVNENASLKEQLHIQNESPERSIVGKSDVLMQVMEIARQAARSRANVLIDGESGTGKGILAEYLHRNGEQNKETEGLFVKINCTAIPENLLEAELFGYEPGAFTGAAKRRQGRVELAHRGTLFLDEIGIAPVTFQAKLLRFLQEGEFERLGSNETIHVESRVISATNTDLKSAIRKGTFREDLYYRLNVIHITLPSLRERQEDIPLLAKKFLEESAKKNGREVPLLHPDALDSLVLYPWPGNIRELQNLMERLVVLSRTGVIRHEDLPMEISGTRRERTIAVPVGTSLRHVERMLMEETLKTTQGDKRLAAKLLGVHPRTIYRFLEGQQPPLPAVEPVAPPVETSSEAGPENSSI
jgi:two-component system, NtrC family, response regulator HydG